MAKSLRIENQLMRYFTFLAALLLASCVVLPRSASAQPAPPLSDDVRHRCERFAVAVGASVSAKQGSDDGTIGHISPGPVLRIGRGCTGWGVQTGRGWFSADLEQPLGLTTAGFGELKIRPVMVGYGYSHGVGPAVVTGKLMVGYAVNAFEMRQAYEDGYRALRSAQSVTSDVSNTFVLKPEVSTWIDMGPKVSLNISTGYAIARPTVTVSSSAGQDRRPIRADMFSVTVGAVYRLF